jgi:PadR family transcriptional regulator PadR
MAISDIKQVSAAMDDQDLYSGLIRLHILYHACREPIFGLGTSEKLSRHGCRISAGTLYPVLHRLQQKGYLRSSRARSGRWLRRVHRATPSGRKALEAAKEKARELFGELFEEAPAKSHVQRGNHFWNEGHRKARSSRNRGGREGSVLTW